MHRKRVLVLGGTGYVGTAVVAALIQEGYEPIVLARNPNHVDLPKILLEKCIILQGDAANLTHLAKKLQTYKPEAFVYLIGLIREFPKKQILFADAHFHWVQIALTVTKQIGVKRFLFMSANGTKYHGTEYQKTKYQGEEAVKNSGLFWTIFRPSFIVGQDSHMQFIDSIKLLLKFPVVPLIGGGNFRMSPVYRDNIARAFATSIGLKKTFDKTYELGGKTYTFKQLIELYAQHARKHIVFFPIPLTFMRFITRVGEHLPFFPLTSDQLTMLAEGNSVPDLSEWNDFGITPKSFEDVLSEYPA